MTKDPSGEFKDGRRDAPPSCERKKDATKYIEIKINENELNKAKLRK